MILRLKQAAVWMVIFLSGVCTSGFAQETTSPKFFIYIQDEGGTPFYVRRDNTLMSSSPAGYIIIPQLDKGQYKLTIGFPGNKAPEESFAVTLSGSGDKGFLLRKRDQGFALLGLRDFKVLQPLAVASAPGNRIVSVPVSPHSRPTGNKDSNAIAQDKKTAQPEIVLDSSAEQKQQVAQATVPADTSGKAGDSDAFSRMLNEITGTAKPASDTVVLSKKSTGTPDTQKVTLAGKKEKVMEMSENTNIDSEQDAILQTDQAVVIPEVNQHKKREQRQKDEPQFITFAIDSSQTTETQNKIPHVNDTGINVAENSSVENDRIIPPVKATVSKDNIQPEEMNKDTAVQHPGIINSDCQHLANEDDFQKVRRKMASRSSEESMYRIAEKYFDGGICYSATQIQSLTYLFMSDEYKYKFLEMAYPHTYDANHFSRLEKTLSGDYYRGRFKAMLKK